MLGFDIENAALEQENFPEQAQAILWGFVTQAGQGQNNLLLHALGPVIPALVLGAPQIDREGPSSRLR